MPPYTYHIRNKVTGLDHKGYIYVGSLDKAEKEAERIASKFGPSTRVIEVDRIRIEMPAKTRQLIRTEPNGLAKKMKRYGTKRRK